jgi:transcriptional regulator with XRE-family HTH domain
MEIKDRIKLIMEKEKMLSGVFAESIGIQQSTLSHILNGRNNPSLDVVMKIHQKFNYVNLDWLLYGTGELIAANRQTANILRDKNEPYLFTDVFPANKVNKPHLPEIHTEENKNHDSKSSFIETHTRKITEIRIFFDDNTFEIFKSEK